jgi:hypothetical protein
MEELCAATIVMNAQIKDMAFRLALATRQLDLHRLALNVVDIRLQDRFDLDRFFHLGVVEGNTRRLVIGFCPQHHAGFVRCIATRQRAMEPLIRSHTIDRSDLKLCSTLRFFFRFVLSFYEFCCDRTQLVQRAFHLDTSRCRRSFASVAK